MDARIALALGLLLTAVAAAMAFVASALVPPSMIFRRVLGWMMVIAGFGIDSYLLALEAACDGQGVAIVPDFLAEPDLAAGRLVKPIDWSVPQPARWYLVSRRDRADEPAIMRFRDWLLSEITRDSGMAPDMAR